MWFSVQAAGEETTAKVQVDDLSVYYGKVAAVKHASLKVHENCVTALIGPSPTS